MFSVQNNNIAMIRGDSGIFKIDVTDVAGNAVALDDNDVLTFTLRSMYMMLSLNVSTASSIRLSRHINFSFWKR